MKQEDYILRQIEQLGQVLAMILARILNIKQVPDAGLSLAEIQQSYGEELDLSLDIILQTPEEEIVDVLISRIKFIDHHLEKMAEILNETADVYDTSGEEDTARNLRLKCIRILEFLEETEKTYSLERAIMIGKLRELI